MEEQSGISESVYDDYVNEPIIQYFLEKFNSESVRKQSDYDDSDVVDQLEVLKNAIIQLVSNPNDISDSNDKYLTRQLISKLFRLSRCTRDTFLSYYIMTESCYYNLIRRQIGMPSFEDIFPKSFDKLCEILNQKN